MEVFCLLCVCKKYTLHPSRIPRSPSLLSFPLIPNMSLTHLAPPLLLLFLLSCPTHVLSVRIAGYESASDVTEHLELDLDQKAMEKYTDDSDWENAKKIYSEGMNSEKEGGLRTLQGFSTSAPDKLKNEGVYELYKKYWDDGTYADTFVSGALDGSGDFSDREARFRGECANKGSQYQNVWMYVIHEMEDAINDCENGDLTDNADGREAWDEAVAFYVGSEVGTELVSTTDGYMLYTLAQKRCQDYGTCDENGVANVNKKVMDAFAEGRDAIKDGNCDDAIDIKNRIIVQMQVPLVQGIHRYLNLTKESLPDGNELEKSWGEGWAFSAAILPIVKDCSVSAAESLEKNFAPNVESPMSDSIEDVSSKLQSAFACMGITCEDVGEGMGLASCSSGAPTDGIKPGTEQSAGRGGGLSSGGIAAIVIVVLLVLGGLAIIFVLSRRKKTHKMNTMPTVNNGQDDQMFA